MENTKQVFEQYSKDVKKIKNKPSDSDLLILYGLYKQATIGDCNTNRPGFLDFKGKSKWDSWNNYKGTNKEEAMKLYIEKAKELIEK